jgi:O-antigen/teichoic acid export membrane protein
MTSQAFRIIKNTFMLYFRQILVMLISLYTVRATLNILGAEDYGIYNVVAGIVVMLGFLNNAMANASRRFFSFELGRDDYEQLRKVFSMSLVIHVLIALLVLIAAETIGLWFVNNKLTIPRNRITVTHYIYQFSVITCLFTITTAPYMASIMAHEDMDIYATLSIVESIFKLGIVFILPFILLDKLQLYGILICVVAFINAVIYRIICKSKYRECKFSFYWNKNLFKEIISYTGWNLIGATSYVYKNYGINILLNQFFNPVVVAARGISASVNNATSSFFQNFNTALNPQITKHYARGQKVEMMQLMFQGAKGTYFLMYLFTLPLMVEIPQVLLLWLKNPPEYTVLFTRLVLLDVLINSMTYPLLAAVQAVGKIKLHSSVVFGIQLLNLPLSWIALRSGAPAYSVLLIAIFLTCTAFIAHLFIIKHLIRFSIKQFFRKIILPVIAVSGLSAILPIVLCVYFDPTFLRLCGVVVVSIISTCGCMFLIGLNSGERKNIVEIISKRIKIV